MGTATRSRIISRVDGLCMDGTHVAACSADRDAQQLWTLAPAPSMNLYLGGGSLINNYQKKIDGGSALSSSSSPPRSCIDVYNFTGPSVSLSGRCKQPNNGSRGSQNEQFSYDSHSGLFHSGVTQSCCSTPSRPVLGPMCLTRAATPPPPPPPPLRPINIPFCLATASNPDPPPMPPSPPSVDASLPLQVWAGPLANGDVAVALVNTDDAASHNITAKWSKIGLPTGALYTAKDLYSGLQLGPFVNSLSLPVGPHDVRALRLTKKVA